MEDIIKLVGSIVSLFAIYKIFVDVIFARSAKRREDYNLTKTFLQDLDNPKTHPYVIEKGFQALTGDFYSLKEIKYLLTFKSSSEAIFKRSFAKTFIDFDEGKDRYCWKEPYSAPLKQKYSSTLYVLAYIIFGYIGTLPLYSSTFPIQSSYLKLIWIGAFTTPAILWLIKREKFLDAQRFMKMDHPSSQENTNES